MNRIALILFFITIPVFLFSQSHPDTFRLFKKGEIFKSLSSGNPVGNGIGRIIAREGTIWIGTGNGASISTDNGETWTNKTFGNEGVAAIGYDKYHNIFWVSTLHTENVSGIGKVQVGSGLHYTTDKGNTWSSIPEPVDDPGDSIITYGINNSVRALPITVPQQNIVWHMDFTPNNIWIACWAGGIRRSSDMGQNWERVLLPSDSLNTLSPTDTVDYALSPQTGKFGTGYLNFLGFSVAVINDSTVYAGTVNGINKSTNAEAQYPSWTKFNHLNQENSISGDWVWTINYNKSDSSLWAATWKAEGYTEFQAVSYSTDLGENWKVVLPHERVNGFGFKGDQPIAPSDNGLFRSSNMGITWLTPGFIYDEKTKASITTNYFYSAATSGDTIWVGSGEGLARLIETGTTMWQGDWKVYNSAPETKEAYAFPNPFNPNLDEKITFKYDTHDRNENVTIRIFDFGMNYLRTVIQNAPRKLSSSDPPYDSWDGRDDGGNYVPNGVYFYRIEVGSDDPLFGKIIVLK
jgi:hypothetical protein